MLRPAVVAALLLVFALGFGSNAQATVIYFTATLDGPSENPPAPSPGTGFVLVSYDSTAQLLFIQATFDDLVGTTTVAHIHCCVAAPGNVGVAVTPGTLPGFPVGVTSGSYSVFIDLTFAGSYTAAFLNNFGGGTEAGAEAALVAGMLGGDAYFNIHTSFRPGGEIRGFLQPVPEPGTLGLVALGLIGALARGARARKPRRGSSGVS